MCHWRRRHEVLAATRFGVFQSWILIECAISAMSHIYSIQRRSTLTFGVTYSHWVVWWVIVCISSDDLECKSFWNFFLFCLFVLFAEVTETEIGKVRAYLRCKWWNFSYIFQYRKSSQLIKNWVRSCHKSNLLDFKTKFQKFYAKRISRTVIPLQFIYSVPICQLNFS